MWHASTDSPPPTKKSAGIRCANLTYLSTGLVVSLCRRDLLTGLVHAGCPHLAVKIFRYLDSKSLLASSMVCSDWQKILLGFIYSTGKFRKRVRETIFLGKPKSSEIVFCLESTEVEVVSVAVDEHSNFFVLTGAQTGAVNPTSHRRKPHLMICSLFGLGKKRWEHKFNESIDVESAKLCLVAAGRAMVAVGSDDGKIYVYECNHQLRWLRLKTMLSHHSRAIRAIVICSDESSHRRQIIVSCSDDMTIGVSVVLANHVVHVAKVLHGHVSRVRAVDVQKGCIMSGSDDRSVKLWAVGGCNSTHSNGLSGPLFHKFLDSEAKERPLTTMTGHSGPVTIVQLSLPYGLSAAGSTLRLWDVTQGTCLKLLQHDEEFHVTSITWISTFRGVATIDASGKMRCFDLCDVRTTNHEIVAASSIFRIVKPSTWNHKTDSSLSSTPPSSSSSSLSPSSSASSSTSTSSFVFPSSLFATLSLTDPPPSVVTKLVSMPHHLAAISLAPHTSSSLPTVTVHCLDYIL